MTVRPNSMPKGSGSTYKSRGSNPWSARKININIRGMQAMIHFDNLAQERHTETAHRSKLLLKDKWDTEGGN